MQIEVGTVNKLSRAAMIAGAAVFAYWTLAPTSVPIHGFLAGEDAAQFAAGFGMTMLAYVGFPRRRRTDLTKTVILASALLEILRYLIGHGCDRIVCPPSRQLRGQPRIAKSAPNRLFLTNNNAGS